MNIIRKLKLNSIHPIQLTDVEKSIINYISVTLNNLRIYTMQESVKDVIFYINDNDDWLLDVNTKTKIVNIKHQSVYTPLLAIGLSSNEINELFKYFLFTKNIIKDDYTIKPIMRVNKNRKFMKINYLL